MPLIMLLLLLSFASEAAIPPQPYNLSDPIHVEKIDLALRDYFESSGRWSSYRYDRERWADRSGKRTVWRFGNGAKLFEEPQTLSGSRRLAGVASSRTCPDGVTICKNTETCVGCRCTIFETDTFQYGKLYLANQDCYWTRCGCGVAR